MIEIADDYLVTTRDSIILHNHIRVYRVKLFELFGEEVNTSQIMIHSAGVCTLSAHSPGCRRLSSAYTGCR